MKIPLHTVGQRQIARESESEKGSDKRKCNVNFLNYLCWKKAAKIDKLKWKYSRE